MFFIVIALIKNIHNCNLKIQGVMFGKITDLMVFDRWLHKASKYLFSPVKK